MRPRGPATLLAASLAATTLLGTGAGAARAGAAAEHLRERGRVVQVPDGDTVRVDVSGDGTRTPVPVRLVGIQAAELGTCHATEARDRLRALVLDKVVQLWSVSAGSRNLGRPVRTVYLEGPGRTPGTDAARVLLAEGHVLWFPMGAEWAHNREYAGLAARAAAGKPAAKPRNLWDTDFRKGPCAPGPQQGARVRLMVNWDAPGNDATDVDGEYVVVRNLGSSTLWLGRWLLRDSSIGWYRLPRGTRVLAHRELTVEVGKGRDTATTKHWGRTTPAFDNTTHDERSMGDGAYLVDPDGDLRFWATYPCFTACGDPALGRVEIAHVQYDAPGPQERPDGEYVTVRLVPGVSGPADLEGYVLHVGRLVLPLRGPSVLHRGETLTVRMGHPTEAAPADRLHRYLGRDNATLPNTGGSVTLDSFTEVRVGCLAWGDHDC